VSPVGLEVEASGGAAVGEVSSAAGACACRAGSLTRSGAAHPAGSAVLRVEEVRARRVRRYGARALDRIRREAAARAGLAAREREGARVSARTAVGSVGCEIPTRWPRIRRAVIRACRARARPARTRPQAAMLTARAAVVRVRSDVHARPAARLPCSARDPASPAVRGVRLPVHALPVALDLGEEARRLLRRARGRCEREGDRNEGGWEWAAEHAAMIAPFRPRSTAPCATLRRASAERRGPAC
jgi:hypothetical protein